MTGSTPDQCPFCHLEAGRVLLENDLAIAFPDAYPVSPGHTLVVPRRHVGDFFELSSAETMALFELLWQVRAGLIRQHQPGGFNVGINVGEAAGQTVLARSRSSDTPVCRGCSSTAGRRAEYHSGEGAVP